MTQKMSRIVLASRPEGSPTLANFRLEQADMPAVAEGEVLVEVQYHSLDPYMRGRMDAGPSYAPSVEIGGTMTAGAVGRVLDSRDARFSPGDTAMGMLGWASHGVLPAAELRKIDPAIAPIQTSLGVLGMPGFTGWHGLTEIGKPKSGETLVVGAATGAVGSMVGQLGKAYGLRVVGVAGGAEKCRYAVEELGFDACLDHRAASDAKTLRTELAAQCPDGVDIYFENVGDKTTLAVLPLMNVGGRIPVCGMIGWYDLGGLGSGGRQGTDSLPLAWRTILVKRLAVQGFIIFDHWHRLPDFMAEVPAMIKDGRVKYSETIADGLENAPAAFLGLLKGENFGKQLVRVS